MFFCLGGNISNHLFEVDIISGRKEGQEDTSDYGGQPGSTRKRTVRSRELLWTDAEMVFQKSTDFDGEF